MIENTHPSSQIDLEKRAAKPVIRVMLVDDSAVIRGMLTRIVETDPEIQVVTSASDGAMALAVLRTRPVDVVVLDLEMPNMDGLTALPKLKEIQPSVKIIIVSSLTRENAEIALKAMRLGAEDYLSKPNNTSEMTSLAAFRRDVIHKIKALGSKALKPDAAPPETEPPAPAPGKILAFAPSRLKSDLADALPPARPLLSQTLTASLSPDRTPHRTPNVVSRRPALVPKPAELHLRPLPYFFDLAALAIGSSTGGPQALFTLLADWPVELHMPIFITQHMPPTFTTILGEHISRLSKRQAAEAQDGEIVQPGRIYIAPGDYHLVVEEMGKDVVLRVRQTAPENFCRPSVDPMFSSLAKVYGAKLLAVMLTGMGRDGLAGTQAIVNAGGLVVAQDEASSVVWGMPGTVAQAGLCSALVALPDMASFLQKLVMRGKS